MRRLRGVFSSGSSSRASRGPRVEIEAKFRAPDEEVLARASGSDRAGRFSSRRRHATEEFADIYLDTEDWQILAGGYFCRRRLSEGRVLITLKQVRAGGRGRPSPRGVRGGTARVRSTIPMAGEPARDKVLELSQGAPLVGMLELRQTRTKRLVGALRSVRWPN